MEAVIQFIIAQTAAAVLVSLLRAYKAEKETVTTGGEAVTTDAPVPNGVGG